LIDELAELKTPSDCAGAWEALRRDESVALALTQIAELAQDDLEPSARYARLDALRVTIRELGQYCLALRQPPTPIATYDSEGPP
jgi:hypothetical protein